MTLTCNTADEIHLRFAAILPVLLATVPLDGSATTCADRASVLFPKGNWVSPSSRIVLRLRQAPERQNIELRTKPGSLVPVDRRMISPGLLELVPKAPLEASTDYVLLDREKGWQLGAFRTVSSRAFDPPIRLDYSSMPLQALRTPHSRPVCENDFSVSDPCAYFSARALGNETISLLEVTLEADPRTNRARHMLTAPPGDSFLITSDLVCQALARGEAVAGFATAHNRIGEASKPIPILLLPFAPDGRAGASPNPD